MKYAQLDFLAPETAVTIPGRSTLPYQRHSDTSKTAAGRAKPDSATLRKRVLNLLRATPRGLTDEEIAEALGMNPSTQRPRRIELVTALMVRDSGVTRPTKSGRAAVVWEAI